MGKSADTRTCRRLLLSQTRVDALLGRQVPPKVDSGIEHSQRESHRDRRCDTAWRTQPYQPAVPSASRSSSFETVERSTCSDYNTGRKSPLLSSQPFQPRATGMSMSWGRSLEPSHNPVKIEKWWMNPIAKVRENRRVWKSPWYRCELKERQLMKGSYDRDPIQAALALGNAKLESYIRKKPVPRSRPHHLEAPFRAQNGTTGLDGAGKLVYHMDTGQIAYPFALHVRNRRCRALCIHKWWNPQQLCGTAQPTGLLYQ